MTQKDIQIVRELAKQYMEMASSEKQRKMNQRMKDTNDLKLVRPPLMIDEIPWYQMDMDGELWLVDINSHPNGTPYIWSIYTLVPYLE